MNGKNTIRLTESELNRVISESVKRVLKEGNFSNQLRSSLKTGNQNEVVEIYNFLTDVKKKIHFLYFAGERLNGEIKTKLENAAEIIHKYLTDDVINAVVNGIRQNGIYGGDKKKPIDLSIPFKKRHEYVEPEDWYERVEHGDFDEF